MFLFLIILLHLSSTEAVRCFGQCSCLRNEEFTQTTQCGKFEDFKELKYSVKKWNGLTEIQFNSATCDQMTELAERISEKLEFLDTIISLDSEVFCNPSQIKSIELKCPNGQTTQDGSESADEKSTEIWIAIASVVALNLGGLILFICHRYRKNRQTAQSVSIEEEGKEEESNENTETNQELTSPVLLELSETEAQIDPFSFSHLVSVRDRTATARVAVPSVSLFTREQSSLASIQESQVPSVTALTENQSSLATIQESCEVSAGGLPEIVSTPFADFKKRLQGSFAKRQLSSTPI